MSLKHGNWQIGVAQQAFMDAGYQWREHIYNDGSINNCSVDFTKNQSPTYFCKNIIGDFGWGRYPREVCWSKALEWLNSKNLENAPDHECDHTCCCSHLED